MPSFPWTTSQDKFSYDGRSARETTRDTQCPWRPKLGTLSLPPTLHRPKQVTWPIPTPMGWRNKPTPSRRNYKVTWQREWTQGSKKNRTVIQSATIYNKCQQFLDKCLNSAAWILPYVCLALCSVQSFPFSNVLVCYPHHSAVKQELEPPFYSWGNWRLEK